MKENKIMKNYEVRFCNPMQPGEVGEFIVKANNEIAAVLEARQCVRYDYSTNYQLQEFLVKETNLREMKTAQNWSTFGFEIVGFGNNGYKQVRRAT